MIDKPKMLSPFRINIVGEEKEQALKIGAKLVEDVYKQVMGKK